jgi:hypothetical protein
VIRGYEESNEISHYNIKKLMLACLFRGPDLSRKIHNLNSKNLLTYLLQAGILLKKRTWYESRGCRKLRNFPRSAWYDTGAKEKYASDIEE